MPNREDFPTIKRDLVNKVDEIGKHLNEESIQREEVRVLIGKLSVMVFGDSTVYPPIKGFNDRLEKLEEVEKNRLKNIDWAKKTATGSITIAVGGAVIWLFNVLKVAFIKGGNP